MADRLISLPLHSLGAHSDGRGVHFAVYSQHAEKVELCLFDSSGRHERERLQLPSCTNGVWHGYLPGAQAGQLYGYRAYGPYDPKQGLRFNPNKLLLDPYTRKLVGELRWHDALFGYRIGSPRGDLSFDRRDSAAYMPKSAVVENNFDWGDDHPPRIPWSETIVYELHVGGFTHLRDDLPQHDRGTFGALGHASTIDYLKQLGVTAVELLPTHAFVRDRLLVERGLTNYWGYNTLAFFAPDPAYLSDATLGQMKWAVQRLHAANIEVILDVVYNHTAEGSELGPTLSLRGLDNLTYYRLTDASPRYYVNDTGCGNTLNFSNQRVIQMVLDSLRYWVREYHIDGFRFDLGVTMGREPHGFDPGSGFFDALLQDPELARVKLIVEPWDIGPGGFQLGNHPPGISEWNASFRDSVRRFWRGDSAQRGAFAQSLQGSAELFAHQRRHPWASVNFVTAHDGFTLHDLVSYNHKHNDDNGEDNGDGADENYSCNWGNEGDSDDGGIMALREQNKCNFCTPMLLAGDESGHTQRGNNNVYCQDNALSWIDWSRSRIDHNEEMRAFVRKLIRLRQKTPLLRENYFYPGDTAIAPGLTRVLWFDERGTALEIDDWNNAEARLLGLRRSQINGDHIEIVLLLTNADADAHVFQLPHPHLPYRLVCDTAAPESDERGMDAGECEVAAHALVLLIARIEIRHWSELAPATASTSDEVQ